jgi:AcrR family transcriptional regulator
MSEFSTLPVGRPYRGVSPADRIALRRARLVSSAVTLFGTVGYSATSIKGVCTHAGLTERSFYESFGAKEDLLQAAYRHCTVRLHAVITAAAEVAAPTPSARMLAALAAYFTAIREPALARIVLFEMDGVSAATTATVRTVLEVTTALIRETVCRELAGAPQAGLSAELLASAIMGAVYQLAKLWFQSGYERSQDEIVRNCHAVFLGTIAHWEPACAPAAGVPA